MTTLLQINLHCSQAAQSLLHQVAPMHTQMIRVLQINVGVCRAAQELALATANTKEADVLIISEQHRDRGEDNGWFPDANGRAAIAVLSSISVDAIGQPSSGFRWLEIKGYRIYSCYISPKGNIFGVRGLLVRARSQREDILRTRGGVR